MFRKIRGVLHELYGIYTGYHVPRAAAAMSYYLTLSAFPLMICVGAIVGSFDIEYAELVEAGQGLFPKATLDIIGTYLEYVSRNESPVLIVAAVSILATSSAAAFRIILNVMEEIQGHVRYYGFFRWVISFFVSMLFLVAVYASCLIMISGRWLFAAIGIADTHMSGSAWYWLRFVALFLLIYFLVLIIYFMTSPKGVKAIRNGLGAFAAAISVVAVSVLFSHLMSLSVKYPLVYGSLTSVIILMVWLNTIGLVIIMGSVINSMVGKRRREKRREARRD